MPKLWEDPSNLKIENLTTPFAQKRQGSKLLGSILDLEVGGICYNNCWLNLKYHRTTNHAIDWGDGQDTDPRITELPTEKMLTEKKMIREEMTKPTTTPSCCSFPVQVVVTSQIEKLRPIRPYWLDILHMHPSITYLGATSYQSKPSWACSGTGPSSFLW